METDGYLDWLHGVDLETAALDDLRQAVEAMLAALKLDDDTGEPSEAQMALQEILDELHLGGIPKAEIESFRRDFFEDRAPPEPPEIVLERELREIASGIARVRWSTETYQNLEKAIDAFLEGGEEEKLWATVDAIGGLLDRVAQSYQQTTVLPKEVTMESLVTHRLLCEGIQTWKYALAMLRDGENDDPREEEPDWDAVLQTAEAGNRLLVAVQIYHSRLQSALLGA